MFLVQNKQNELKIRAPRSGARCLGFLIGESGAAVLLSGGGVSPSPAKISEEKLVDLKME